MHDRLASPSASEKKTTPSPNLAEKFTFLVNLLGGDVIVSHRASLKDVVTEAIAHTEGPVAISSDLTRLAPELQSLETRKDGTWITAISRGRLGVAATGSVLLAELDEVDKVLPVLARRHIVLLPDHAIVPTLDDAATTLRELIASGVTHCTFVSGPSRTADIEKILTIGAHGPQSLLIVLVEGW